MDASLLPPRQPAWNFHLHLHRHTHRVRQMLDERVRAQPLHVLSVPALNPHRVAPILNIDGVADVDAVSLMLGDVERVGMGDGHGDVLRRGASEQKHQADRQYY